MPWLEIAEAEPRVSKIHLEIVHADGAQGCPSEAEMRFAVVASLGYDPFVSLDQADRVLSASFAASPEGIETTLSLRTREGRALGEQRLAYGGTNCREAAAAVELVIAMAVDPPSLIDSGFTPPNETAVAPAGVAPAVVADAGTQPSQAGTANRGPAFEVSAGALLEYGSYPHVTGGFTAGAGLRWTNTSIDLELRADLPAEIPVSGGGSVRSALIFGTLAPCLRNTVLGGCALVGVGVEHGSGQGLTPSHQGTTPYVALGARGFVDLGLSRVLRLQPRLELWAPLTRTRLTANETSVWVTPPLSVALGLALVVVWP